MAPNIPEWLILQFACASIGAVLVTVNTNFQSQELAYLLKHSDSKMLFIVDGFKETSYVNMLEELIPELQTAHQEEITSTQFPYLKDVSISVSMYQTACSAGIVFKWQPKEPKIMNGRSE